MRPGQVRPVRAALLKCNQPKAGFDLVPRDPGVHFDAPAVDSTLEVSDARESGSLQSPDSFGAPHSTVAIDDDITMTIERA